MILRGNYPQQNHSLKDTPILKSGHVLTVKCREYDGNFYVKSQVLPSMKKTVVYNCCIVFNKCGSNDEMIYEMNHMNCGYEIK